MAFSVYGSVFIENVGVVSGVVVLLWRCTVWCGLVLFPCVPCGFHVLFGVFYMRLAFLVFL